MSKHATARDVAPDGERPTGHTKGGATASRLYVHVTRRGTWVVREEGDRRGGSFFTQSAAMKFIQSEFGADAQIVATNPAHKKAA